MSKQEKLPSLSINSFYGKRKQRSRIDWETRLEHAERKLKTAPVIKQYRSRLDAPCILRQTFYRQQEAFDFAHLSSQDLKVFAFESPTLSEPGKRMYLVCSYEHFWHYYSQLFGDQRHHYEIIPEGAVCKLYFDLEFSKDLNPNHDGYKIVKLFIKFLVYKLHQEFGVSCEPSHILQLDSSSDSKFSQHLIFNIPNVAFKDNAQAGIFVQHVVGDIWKTVRANDDQNTKTNCECYKQDMAEGMTNPGPSMQNTMMDCCVQNIVTNYETTDSVISPYFKLSTRLPPEDNIITDPTERVNVWSWAPCANCLSQLVVKDKNNRETLLCDTGVYTKNRNFRVYLSSKIGKNRPLVVGKNNIFHPRDWNAEASQQNKLLFMESLVSNVRFTEKLRVLSYETESESRSSNEWTNAGASKSQQRADCPPMGGSGTNSCSPYPEIDSFVCSHVINKGGVQGSIRRWLYFSKGELLLYDISTNRWCGNVGRQHKSNNILIVVSVKEGFYYQKCHDPDCKQIDYKSPNYSLPREILPQVICMDDSGFDDDFIGVNDLSDCELLTAIHSLEMPQSIPEQHESCDVTDYDLMKAVLELETSCSSNSPDVQSSVTNDTSRCENLLKSSGHETGAHEFSCEITDSELLNAADW